MYESSADRWWQSSFHSYFRFSSQLLSGIFAGSGCIQWQNTSWSCIFVFLCVFVYLRLSPFLNKTISYYSGSPVLRNVLRASCYISFFKFFISFTVLSCHRESNTRNKNYFYADLWKFDDGICQRCHWLYMDYAKLGTFGTRIMYFFASAIRWVFLI